MPRSAAARHSSRDTRTRILEAAIRRFSQYSYEETKLRDIAEDVGVDLAFVHRSFGSKEQLFSEALKVAFEVDDALRAERADLSISLAERVLEPSRGRVIKQVDPLDIVVRSLSSREAIPVLRDFTVEEFIKPLAGKIGDAALQRAAVIAACLMGISVLRNVVVIEPLVDDNQSDLASLIRRVLDVPIDDVPISRSRVRRTASSKGKAGQTRRRRDT